MWNGWLGGEDGIMDRVTHRVTVRYRVGGPEVLGCTSYRDALAVMQSRERVNGVGNVVCRMESVRVDGSWGLVEIHGWIK